MAKKKLEGDSSSLKSVFDLVQSIDKNAEIIADSAYSNILEWIPTGSYILNAAMSGDLFKGAASGRFTIFQGDSGVGKSFLACSICREAQKMGYTPIYMDSEGAIDSTFVSRLGVDPKNLIIKQVSTISETSGFVANVCKQLSDQEETHGTHQKVMFVLDSLGNLSSDKETDDTLSGNNKRDMTKAQEIRALFRVNSIPIAKLQIPFIICNHVYAVVGSYVPTNTGAGGGGVKYAASLTMELSAAKLEDKENEQAAAQRQGSETGTKTGVLVTAKAVKSRFCRPYKVKFQIPYYKEPNPFVGLEAFMNWENSGVVRGNILSEKDFNKLSPSEQEKLAPFAFEYNGEKMWAQPKETARGIIVKHLGRTVTPVEFYSKTVFTPDYLEYLNEHVIHPMFDLPDQSAFDDIKEIEDILETGETVNETEE